jgi:hypothetical protein
MKFITSYIIQKLRQIAIAREAIKVHEDYLRNLTIPWLVTHPDYDPKHLTWKHSIRLKNPSLHHRNSKTFVEWEVVNAGEYDLFYEDLIVPIEFYANPEETLAEWHRNQNEMALKKEEERQEKIKNSELATLKTLLEKYGNE